MCIYWPGVTDDIKESVSACKPCLNYATKQQREPYAIDAQVKPRTLISLDNFDFQGTHFIMVLDVATKFFVVRPVYCLNTDTTIQVLMSIFSEHSMPVAIRSDRGHNFMSDLFQQYCSHLGIKLSYSSIYHHSTNLAERAIRTVKGLMKNALMQNNHGDLHYLNILPHHWIARLPPHQSEMVENSVACYSMFQISPLSTLTNWLKDTMPSCTMIHRVRYKRSYLLAVLLAIVIILIINFMLVLFQKGKAGHMQLVQRIVE